MHNTLGNDPGPHNVGFTVRNVTIVIALSQHLQRMYSYEHCLGRVLLLILTVSRSGELILQPLYRQFLSCFQLLFHNSYCCISSCRSGGSALRLHLATWSSCPSNVSACFEGVSFLCVGGSWEVLGINPGHMHVVQTPPLSCTQAYPHVFFFFNLFVLMVWGLEPRSHTHQVNPPPFSHTPTLCSWFLKMIIS